MDLLDEELILAWKALEQNSVKYMMVGGFATNLHGFSRTTADMDLWIEDTLENRKNLLTALTEMGLSNLESILSTQLIPGWTSIKLQSGFELDIMTSLKGFETGDFNECFDVASEAKIQDVTVRFLHLNHLIRSKEAANRPKDQIDVLELRRIRDESI